ncbi:uncharacterized protein LOC143177012 [Calliopsis andreniformis]|uniref:uncharacterized protein LOC143177012 n=1 Tax=Calliopsis andreniformis TaxID=337506 RepID=UPI003FCD14CE
MNDDGRGGNQYCLHREFFAKTFQPRGRFDFHQREEGAEHGRTQQPSRGDESWFHPAQQQRDGSREKPRDHGSTENRRGGTRFLRYAKKAFPVERCSVRERRGQRKKLS